MRIQTAIWIGSTALAFAFSAAVSLVAVAYVSSAIAAEFAGREYVLAVQTLVWTALSGLAALWIGSALTASVTPRMSAAALIAATAAVVTAFAIYADARALTGALDIDQVGLALWVPVALVATATCYLCADSGPAEARPAWLWVASLAALLAAFLVGLTFVMPARHGILAVVTLGVAMLACLSLAVISLLDLKTNIARADSA